MSESAAKNPPIWATITTDPELGHGAVRLWFYLRNVRFNRKSKTAWPGQRRIAADISANIHSIKPWIKQLETGGYLVKQAQGQRHAHVYSFPILALRKEATRNDSGVAPFDTSRCGDRQRRVCPKEATEPQSKEPQSMKGQAPRVELSSAERISLERELERIPEALKAICDATSHNAWGPMYGEAEKSQIRKLKTRRGEILNKLGAVA